MAGKKASTGKIATRGRKIKDTNIVVEDTSSKKSNKKPADSNTSLNMETYLEIGGIQYGIHGLEDRIKEAYKAEGHRVSSIKSLQVYINPYERRAYYVINGKSENKYVEL